MVVVTLVSTLMTKGTERSLETMHKLIERICHSTTSVARKQGWALFLYVMQLLVKPPQTLSFRQFGLVANDSGHVTRKLDTNYPFILTWAPGFLPREGPSLISCRPYKHRGKMYMRAEKRTDAHRGCDSGAKHRRSMPPVLLGILDIAGVQTDITDALAAVLGPERDCHGHIFTVRELYYIFAQMMSLPTAPSEDVSLSVLLQSPSMESVTYQSSDSIPCHDV